MALGVAAARGTEPTGYLMLDWNGTVVDDVTRAHVATATAIDAVDGDGTVGSLSEFRASFRLPLPRFFSDLGVAADGVDRAVGIWNEQMAARPTALAPGATALLSSARDLGMEVHVISGAHRFTVLTDADALGVSGLIDTVSGSVNSKRDVMTSLRRTSAPSIYVGDTEYDVREALAAGAIAVGTSYGYTPAARLRRAGASLVVDDLDELVPLVKATATA